jgi:hypothetical protein
MAKGAAWIVVLMGTAGIVGLALLIGDRHGSVSANPAATAGVIALSGAVAVGIERTLEAVWTFVGSLAGTWAPIGPVAKHVNDLVDGLDSEVKPFFDHTIKVLGDVKKMGDEEKAVIKNQVEALQKKAVDLKSLTAGSERAQLVSAAVSQAVIYAQSAVDDPGVKARGEAALAAVSGVADLAGSFQDHPGRRLISIYLGTIVGLMLALTFNLDLFTAILGVPAAATVAEAPFKFGILLTGFAIGLGSNPTHEVVKALQEYKNATKSKNTP